MGMGLKGAPRGAYVSCCLGPRVSTRELEADMGYSSTLTLRIAGPSLRMDMGR